MLQQQRHGGRKRQQQEREEREDNADDGLHAFALLCSGGTRHRAGRAAAETPAVLPDALRVHQLCAHSVSGRTDAYH